MGTSSANWKGFWIHENPGAGIEEWGCGYHHGALGIDTTFEHGAMSDYYAIRAKVLANDQTGFNALCAQAMGQWWQGLTPEMRQAAWTGERARYSGLY